MEITNCVDIPQRRMSFVERLSLLPWRESECDVSDNAAVEATSLAPQIVEKIDKGGKCWWWMLVVGGLKRGDERRGDKRGRSRKPLRGLEAVLKPVPLERSEMTTTPKQREYGVTYRMILLL